MPSAEAKPERQTELTTKLDLLGMYKYVDGFQTIFADLSRLLSSECGSKYGFWIEYPEID